MCDNCNEYYYETGNIYWGLQQIIDDMDERIRMLENICDCKVAEAKPLPYISRAERLERIKNENL